MSENMGKHQFDAIEIPEQLTGTVRRGIRKGKRTLFWRYTSSSAATLLILIFITANVPALYARAAEIPFLAPVVRMMRVGSGGSQVSGAVGTVEAGENSLTITFTDGEGKPISVPTFSAARRKLPQRIILRIHGLAEGKPLNLWEALKNQEAIADAYPLSATDETEQGVILHLKPGWECAAMQYENRLTLQFTWEKPEREPETGYVLCSKTMEPGTELAKLTEDLLWEGATQLRLSQQDYRVVLGEFPTREQAEKARKTILETKNIQLEILPIPVVNP